MTRLILGGQLNSHKHTVGELSFQQCLSKRIHNGFVIYPVIIGLYIISFTNSYNFGSYRVVTFSNNQFCFSVLAALNIMVTNQDFGYGKRFLYCHSEMHVIESQVKKNIYIKNKIHFFCSKDAGIDRFFLGTLMKFVTIRILTA